MADDKKAIALERIINLMTSIVLCISYSMTIDMLTTLENGNLDIFGFIRGAAVFLIPCAIEGINIIMAKTGKKVGIDITELIISVVSLIVGGYLLYSALANKNFLPVIVIEILLTIYPLKYIINVFDGFIELAKRR